MFRKNTASQFIHFQGVDATTGGIKTGVTWTIRRCIDGTFAAGGGTVTEDGTTGWYKYAMSQADTNGNNIAFNFTGTGAVPQTINIITTACDPTTATNFGITSLPTTAVTTNGSLITMGTGTAQLNVSGGRADSGTQAVPLQKLSLLAGSTSQTINVFIGDVTSLTGKGLTGLVFNTASLQAYYALPKAASVSITLATLAGVTSAYSSGGFKEIDATNMPGWYRFDIPNAAIASGRFVTLQFQGATNMAPTMIELELTAVDNQDATAFGVSRIDAAISSRMATYTQPTGFLAATFPSGTIANTTNITAGTIATVTNRVTANTDQVNGVAQTGGDIYPAVTNIGVTSAALNKIADSRTITTGTGEANTYTSTAAADGTYHSISDSAGSIDFYYEATLPTTGGALTGVNWLGYVVGVVNTVKVYIYNWTNSGWDQVGSVVGIAGTVNMDSDFDATNDHTGTGANALKVRFRFSATGLTSATVKTDRLLFGYTVVATYQSGDAFARLGSPAGASIAADLAEIEVETDDIAAIKAKTDFLPSATAGAAGGVMIAGSNAATTFASLDITGATTLAGAISATNASNDIRGIALHATQAAYAPLKPTTAGRTLDVATTGEAGLDFTNRKDTLGILPGAAAGSPTGLALAGNCGLTFSQVSVSSATSTTITIAASFGADDFITGWRVRVTTNTGQYQERTITAWNDSTQTATVSRAFNVTPDVTSSVDLYQNDAPKTNSSLEVVASSVTAGVTLAASQHVIVDSGTVTNLNAIADAVLGRGVGNVEDTADAHSLATLILGTTEYKIEGSIWHIYKIDGTTLFVDKTLSVSSEGHITQVQ